MTTDNRTCSERIKENFQSRAEHFEELFNSVEVTESSDEAYDELNNIALEVTKFTVVKVLLSTGGPADWIEIKINEDGDVRSMEYHFSDWFDHASMPIHSDSYLWEYGMYSLNFTTL